MILNTANNAASTLASTGGISDSDTSLDVASGDGASFPDPPFVVSIGDEIILVEAKSNDTFSSLTRGYEGTTAASHSAGDDVEHRWTAGQAEAINGHPFTTLSFASTVDWDVQDDPNPSLTLTGDATLDASNLPSRVQSGVIKVTQDGTGGHTLTFGSGFTAEGGTAPDVDETASATTYVYYFIDEDATTAVISDGRGPAGSDATTEVSINDQTGTSYTLALSDQDSVVRMDNSSANTVTVPPESSVDFPTGAVVMVSQQGTGTTSIAAGSGVTINSSGTDLAAQYSAVSLVKVGTDEWDAYGDFA